MVASPIPSSSPLVAPSAWPSMLSINHDPQSPHLPPPSSTSSSSTSSSSNATPPPILVPLSNGPPPILMSSEQRRRGEEDPFHPPLPYFLLIDVFVSVKEIITGFFRVVPTLKDGVACLVVGFDFMLGKGDTEVCFT